MIPTKPEKGFAMIVHEKIGEISNEKTWTKELRIVEWGRHEPKFDIRSWSRSNPDFETSGKGITFTKEELIKLKEILDSMDLEGYVMPQKKLIFDVE